MITLRPSEQRGQGKRSWLDSRFTFSFDQYYDPAHMGFRVLRVINEDRIAGGGGFPLHPHRDMEILTYVVEGALQHEDTLGTRSIISAHQMQRITAGTGIEHAECNASDTDPVHLLQIWILPERPGLTPGYEERTFPEAEKLGRLRLVAARDGRDGALTVHQDAAIYAALLEPGSRVTHPLRAGRHAWVQLIAGEIALNGQPLKAGDGAAVSDESALELAARERAHLLLFDLP